MTSFYEYGKQQLQQHGMFESQATEVMARIVSDPNFMGGTMDRWTDMIEDYPPLMPVMIFSAIKEVGLKFIDETCPKAWFRPMFLPVEERDAWLKAEGFDKFLEKNEATVMDAMLSFGATTVNCNGTVYNIASDSLYDPRQLPVLCTVQGILVGDVFKITGVPAEYEGTKVAESQA